MKLVWGLGFMGIVFAVLQSQPAKLAQAARLSSLFGLRWSLVNHVRVWHNPVSLRCKVWFILLVSP